jgi:L-cystine uptake protein TcyP (sodium:dicarboxylate symporter family)
MFEDMHSWAQFRQYMDIGLCIIIPLFFICMIIVVLRLDQIAEILSYIASKIEKDKK